MGGMNSTGSFAWLVRVGRLGGVAGAGGGRQGGY
jgi:hypothetical protein